ncbi:MAG: hypothetical protein AAFN74_27555, partial [Myxococcota bacterium]
RAVALLASGFLLGTSVYGTLFWLTHDAGPPAAAFGPATLAIRQGYQRGDVILLSPFYATRAREFLGDLNPLAVRRPLNEDLDVYSRVWVFGLFGAEQAVGTELETAGFRPAFARHRDGIAVLRYDRPAPFEVTYDFVDSVPKARVSHDVNGKRTPCSKWQPRNQQGGPPGRWVCPQNSDWFYVGAEWHRMGDHLRWCLWAHPPNQGQLVIEFPDVPLEGVVAGHAGHTLNASRRARAPVHLDVKWGDNVPQRFTFALKDHFRPFRLKVPTTTTATVSFAVSTADAGVNHFCFAADVRREVER